MGFSSCGASPKGIGPGPLAGGNGSGYGLPGSKSSMGGSIVGIGEDQPEESGAAGVVGDDTACAACFTTVEAPSLAAGGDVASRSLAKRSSSRLERWSSSTSSQVGRRSPWGISCAVGAALPGGKNGGWYAAGTTPGSVSGGGGYFVSSKTGMGRPMVAEGQGFKSDAASVTGTGPDDAGRQAPSWANR